MEHEGRCVGNRVNAYTSDMDFHGGSKLSKLTYPIKTIYSSEARKKLRLVLDDFQPDVCHLNNFNYQLTPSMILEIVNWRKKSGHSCKIVFTAHDYQLVCPNHMLNNPVTHENCEKCLGGHFINCANTTIYYFHVPLFFICSGYLYQKYSKVNDFKSWKENVTKKALALGVPYVTFSTATWILKTIFSGSVNDQIGGLGDTLLLHPTAPYWYLYALFFIFLVTPTFSTVKMASVGLVVAIVAKVYILTGGVQECMLYQPLSQMKFGLCLE